MQDLYYIVWIGLSTCAIVAFYKIATEWIQEQKRKKIILKMGESFANVFQDADRLYQEFEKNLVNNLADALMKMYIDESMREIKQNTDIHFEYNYE